MLPGIPTCCTLSWVETSIRTSFPAKQVFYVRKRACFCTTLHNVCSFLGSICIFLNDFALFCSLLHCTSQNTTKRDRKNDRIHPKITKKNAQNGPKWAKSSWNDLKILWNRYQNALQNDTKTNPKWSQCDRKWPQNVPRMNPLSVGDVDVAWKTGHKKQCGKRLKIMSTCMLLSKNNQKNSCGVTSRAQLTDNLILVKCRKFLSSMIFFYYSLPIFWFFPDFYYYYYFVLIISRFLWVFYMIFIIWGSQPRGPSLSLTHTRRHSHTCH